ncbi:Sas10 C-terminal domain-containing protein [Lipomyces oligophaga]|uniref:Sas10 C-terminal domain-containing protein n=1 Tax=Lipomyces oligophaga TaxID=45792 RepID=UPI0034CE6BFE
MAPKRNRRSEKKGEMRVEMEHDPVDEFYDQREKILLENNQVLVQDEPSDEEVLGLNEETSDEEDYVLPSKIKKAIEKQEKGTVESDSDDEDEWRQVQDQPNEVDLLSGWGSSAKAYYNIDELSDEEAAKEEEDAARQIQQKMLNDMNAGDFLDDFEQELVRATKEEDEVFSKAVRDVVPQIDIESMTKEDRLKLLKTQNPEVLPLAKEFSELVPEFKLLQQTSIKSVKFIALASYLACISAYLTLFIDKSVDEDTLRERHIMNHLLVLRRYWKRISQAPPDELEDTPDLISDDDMEGEEEASEEQEPDQIADFQSEKELDNTARENIIAVKLESTKRKRTTALPDLDNLEADHATPLSKKSKPYRLPDASNDFADPKTIDAVDLADKQTKRKSLRFYTSKINQKATLRQQRFAGDDDLPYRERNKDRLERLNQLAELRGNTKAKSTDADFLDTSASYNNSRNSDDDYDNDLTSSVSNSARLAVSDDDDKDDLYSMVKSAQDRKKQDKQALKDSLKLAAKQGTLKQLQESASEDGKRAINYQILKNKGLTPKRKKENRNPRVKRRLKYEKAQKKLASMKAVYKPPTGVYGGELTGIKKNTTKSMKFN